MSPESLTVSNKLFLQWTWAKVLCLGKGILHASINQVHWQYLKVKDGSVNFKKVVRRTCKQGVGTWTFFDPWKGDHEKLNCHQPFFWRPPTVKKIPDCWFVQKVMLSYSSFRWCSLVFYLYMYMYYILDPVL